MTVNILRDVMYNLLKQVVHNAECNSCHSYDAAMDRSGWRLILMNWKNLYECIVPSTYTDCYTASAL